MTDQICHNCKWFRPMEAVNGICMHPANDELYLHFNSSTGDYVKNIRRAMEVEPTETCNLYEHYKKKTAK